VYEIQSTGSVFRKIALLVLIGFGVVFLSGPIVAVLSVVLSFAAVLGVFALIGFLVWLPFRMLLVGKDATIANVHEVAAAAGRDFGRFGRGVAQVLAFPVRVLTGILGAALQVTWFAGKTAFTTVRFVTGMAFLAVFGALLGALCGLWMSNVHHQDVESTMIMNTLVGAGLAVLAGLILALPKRRQPIAPVAN
jgi:hypothetical protein